MNDSDRKFVSNVMRRVKIKDIEISKNSDPIKESTSVEMDGSVQNRDDNIPGRVDTVQEVTAPVQEDTIPVQDNNVTIQEADIPMKNTDIPAQEANASVQEPAPSLPENNAYITENKTRSPYRSFRRSGEQNSALDRKNQQPAEETFFQKLVTSIFEGSVFGGIIIYVLIIVNLIGMTVFARRAILNITQDIMYIVHLDSINFRTMTFLEISVLMSYFVSFIFGGLVVFALLKIASMLSNACDFAYSHKVTRLIVYVFMTVFAVASLFIVLSGNGLLSTAVSSWMVPLCTFAGGLAMYCISLRNVEII